MKMVIRTLWGVIVIGAIALTWWFAYGPWQNAGNKLLSHDTVRFGPVPIYLTMAWGAIIAITLFISWISRTGKRS